jgi:hypothetical protein
MIAKVSALVSVVSSPILLTKSQISVVRGTIAYKPNSQKTAFSCRLAA